MNLYVGNLSRDVTDEELRKEFEAFGTVSSVNVIKDKYSGQSRGFGFVEMPDKTEGQAAIAGLKGKVLMGRTIDVSESRPKTEGGAGRSSGGSRGGYGGGSGGNRGGSRGGSSGGGRGGFSGGGGGSGGGRRRPF